MAVCLYDLDGTIVDTEESIKSTLRQFCELYKFPTPTEDALDGISGLDPLVLLPPELVEKRGHAYLTVEFWTLYQRHCTQSNIRLIPGVDKLMQAVEAAGFKAAVVTNKEGSIARKELGYLQGRYELPHEFCIGFGDTDAPRKPDPGMLLHALRRLDAKTSETIFIGDTAPDIQAAESLGIKSILYRKPHVRRREGTLPDWATRATFVVEHMHEAEKIYHKIVRDSKSREARTKKVEMVSRRGKRANDDWKVSSLVVPGGGLPAAKAIEKKAPVNFVLETE